MASVCYKLSATPSAAAVIVSCFLNNRKEIAFRPSIGRTLDPGKTSTLMIVAMQDSASEDQIQQVIDRLVHFGFEVHRSTGARQTVLGGVGVPREFDTGIIEMLPGVQGVHRITSPYKLAGRSFRPEGTVVKLANGIEIGGKKIVVMAGPCSVETREQLFTSLD